MNEQLNQSQLHINGRVRILWGEQSGKLGTIYNCAYDRPAPWHVRPDDWPADVPGIAYKADELQPTNA